jgi:DNA invertase Pin-like site-specific DNA recombinase
MTISRNPILGIGGRTMKKKTAVYIRVSSDRQTHRSQLAELERWHKANPDVPVREYRDKATGKTMDCPGWSKLWADVEAGKVDRIVVWRLDRLGRTASGLTALFEHLQSRSIGLISLRDSLDLSTPSGRLMANVLASVAAYETEVRAERVRAGIAAARAEGKTWGGRKGGSRNKSTATKAEAVRKLHAAGESISAISRTTGISRPTVYSLLRSD